MIIILLFVWITIYNLFTLLYSPSTVSFFQFILFLLLYRNILFSRFLNPLGLHSVKAHNSFVPFKFFMIFWHKVVTCKQTATVRVQVKMKDMQRQRGHNSSWQGLSLVQLLSTMPGFVQHRPIAIQNSLKVGIVARYFS